MTPHAHPHKAAQARTHNTAAVASVDAIRARLRQCISATGDLFGDHRVSLLAGPAHAAVRLELLQMAQPPKLAAVRSASLEALRAALCGAAGIDNGDPAAQEEALRSWMLAPPDAPAAPTPLAQDSPALTLARWVENSLFAGGDRPLGGAALQAQADRAFGGTQADAAYSIKDAYDALELGVNLALGRMDMAPAPDLPSMVVLLERLQRLQNRLPRQTRRDAEMDAYQQFSTPPTLAALACWCAAIGPADIALEPSAGVGAIAVFARLAGAGLILNELSERRAALLGILFPDTPISREDGAQLHHILPAAQIPSCCVMNPPFSVAPGRLPSSRDTALGARHIEQALLRLAPGGRLVTLAGRGLGPDRSASRGWWQRLRRSYTVRGNLGLAGKLYARYGTTTNMRLLVIDKCGPSVSPELVGEFDDLEQLATALAPLRDLRAAPAPASTRTVKSGGHAPARAPIRQSADATPTASATTAAAVALPEAGPAAPPGAINEGVFEAYAPARRAGLPDAPHPGLLVQSAAMAAVDLPPASYVPQLPLTVLSEGRLSLAQYEAVTYAGQAHQERLPGGERRGFFIGDGTGVGKGRSVAAVMLDNLCQGRRRAVWLSERAGLLQDARRDFAGVGGDPGQLFNPGLVPPHAKLPGRDGIAFLSYHLLASSEKQREQGPRPATRLQQLAEWLGPDFDGVIAFDECHNMANSFERKGTRGKSKAAAKALAGIALQEALPNARVLYVSATGATEVGNLRYLCRLGLWGAGTPFACAADFVGGISAGGVAAMELVSRDMKALGCYMARSLSYEGVTYERLLHTLTPLQTDIYNALADTWQHVLARVNEALGTSGQARDGAAKSAALARFWGVHQRFFNQVICALQMPTILARAREELDAGRAVVLQLVNTNEAAQERQLTSMAATDAALDELDFTPRQDLYDYVRNGFPVQQYETYEDTEGNTRSRPVVDAAGHPVFNRELVAEREQLLQTLVDIRVPDNPIDTIVNAFGADMVAEVTGRSRRFVLQRDDAGDLHPVEQRRSNTIALADAAAFMDDRKRVLVFSDAGGTGYSFHADLSRANQRRRVHFLVQPGWRADKAVQGLGRTHRSNEASQPHYILPTTNLEAQRRFVSSIARRLDQLGALTKGQRQAAAQGLFTAEDNLESEYATRAMRMLFRDMYHGHCELEFHATTAALGLHGLIDPKTGALNEDKLPTIPRFLNRLLSLRTTEQDLIFGVFYKGLIHIVNMAKQQGNYDHGVATLRARSARIEQQAVVHTDHRTGARTVYVRLELQHPTRSNPFDLLPLREPDGAWVDTLAGFYRLASGQVVALQRMGTCSAEDGSLLTRARQYAPTGNLRYHDDLQSFLQPQHGRAPEPLSPDQARPLWERQLQEAPATYAEQLHLLTGVLLPLWDRLPGSPRVVRTQTDDGVRLLGRILPADQLQATLTKLGMAGHGPLALSPLQVAGYLDNGGKALLVNGWELARAKVAGQWRIELTARGLTAGQQRTLEGMALFMERINWRERWFVPGAASAEVLARLLDWQPAAEYFPRPGDDAGMCERHAA